jgi:hypothetical protein
LSQQAIKNFVLSERACMRTADVLLAYFQLIQGRYLHAEISKENLYTMCQMLKDNGFSLKEISGVAKIPYTTLRDNLT